MSAPKFKDNLLQIKWTRVEEEDFLMATLISTPKTKNYWEIYLI